MCGIVAYTGPRKTASILLDGLKRLEYRGYDSAGLAVHESDAQIDVVRAAGKLFNLENALGEHPLAGTCGIGHTRWATHGKPNEENAHPHVSGGVAVVHNGIIENHATLRAELVARGANFRSETDTEIVAHLLREALENGAPDLVVALRQTIAQIRGAYALAVLWDQRPDEVVLARQDSPLILGTGDGENFAASDIPALLGQTNQFIALEDGDIARISPSRVEVWDRNGQPTERKIERVTWTASQAEKGGFKHFMLKEIHEQPRAIEDTLRGRIDPATGLVNGPEIGLTDELIAGVERVYFLACGTSAHAAMTGRYWVESLAQIPAQVEIASEVRYRDPVFRSTDLIVCVSQSGETADTLAAAKAARTSGAKILSIVNVQGSALTRVADATCSTHAGPEIGVASTKCFTTQLLALLLVAMRLGQARGVLSSEQSRVITDEMVHLPAMIRETLKGCEDQAEAIAQRVRQSRSMLVLGRGLSFPIALEGALKVKEISYIHAEGYAAGEMKHGPIALIDEELPVVIICPTDRHLEKTLSNLQEVAARGARVVVVGTAGDDELAQHIGEIPEIALLHIPKCTESLSPFLSVVPLQLLSYYIADLNGTDVDQPRNLAKTVTVE